jgi:signal transduction histidine kinase
MIIKHSLRAHLLLFCILLVVICLVAAPLGISVIMGSQFDVYINERATQEQKEITMALRDIYIAEGGWNLFRVGDIAKQVLRGPLIAVSLRDKTGWLMWGARRRGSQILSWQMRSRSYPANTDYQINLDYPTNYSQGSLNRHTMPIIANDTEVGILEFVSVPLPEGVEAQFLNRFHSYMYIAVLGMLIIAGGLSFIVANGLSRPILKAARRAEEISGGGYQNSEEKVITSVIEIETLTNSLESLARSLEGQEILRKRLMSDVTHELRTPVSIIKAQIEAIADGVLPAEQANFTTCVKEADRLTRLIASVENLSIIEGDSLVLKKEQCDISSMLTDIASSFILLLQDAGIKLEQNIKQGLFAYIDSDKIKQVFDNLVANALRYTDSGGTVELSAWHEIQNNNKVTIVKVRDTGIGISENDLPNIFDRFYRTDISRARDTGGRGLGLSIAKAIVTSHGGSIYAENNPHHTGSTFTVILQ